jgi:GNAT superfamily N-acetyltransferase
MIEIREAIGKKGIKDFVCFPFSLYKNNPYWVPPIIKDEMEVFDPSINPVFKTAQARFFLAYMDGEIVGRVAAMINWIEVKEQKIKKMRFGWMDFIDNKAVSKALIEKVAEIGREYELTYMEGPVGFSNLDKVGCLIEGFDHIGTMITWYNHPYYAAHFKSLGFVKEKEYMENIFPFSNIDPSLFNKAQELIKRRYKLKALNFTKTKDILPYANKMFDLFNESYANLSSFVPITEVQKDFFTNRYLSFINPEFIKFVLDEQDNLVAFAILMPSFSKALQKANGRLFPFGLFHLLQARRKSKDIIFYLIGVHPKYQNKGLTAILFHECWNACNKKGIEKCIRTPELEENIAIKNLWSAFDPKVHKRRRTYKKIL